jgi:hypothetical protein
MGRVTPKTLRAYLAAIRSVHVNRVMPVDVFENPSLRRLLDGATSLNPSPKDKTLKLPIVRTTLEKTATGGSSRADITLNSAFASHSRAACVWARSRTRKTTRRTVLLRNKSHTLGRQNQLVRRPYDIPPQAQQNLQAQGGSSNNYRSNLRPRLPGRGDAPVTHSRPPATVSSLIHGCGRSRLPRRVRSLSIEITPPSSRYPFLQLHWA